VRTNTRRRATGKLISCLSARPRRLGCRGRYLRCGETNRSTSDVEITRPFLSPLFTQRRGREILRSPRSPGPTPPERTQLRSAAFGHYRYFPIIPSCREVAQADNCEQCFVLPVPRIVNLVVSASARWPFLRRWHPSIVPKHI
jgi:hypothetical protein